MSLYVGSWNGKKLNETSISDDILVRNFQFKDTWRIGPKVKSKSLAWIGVLWFHKRRSEWITSSLDDFRRQSTKAILRMQSEFSKYEYTSDELATLIREKLVKDLELLKSKFKKEVKVLDW